MKLKLTPSTDAEVSSHLSLLTSAGPMVVPVHVRKPYADVRIRSLTTLINFGQHRVGSSAPRTIYLDNVGAAAAQYSISLIHAPSSREGGLVNESPGFQNTRFLSSKDEPPNDLHQKDDLARSNFTRAAHAGDAGDSSSVQTLNTLDSQTPCEAAPGDRSREGDGRDASIEDGEFRVSPSSGCVQGKSSAAVKIVYAATCVGMDRAVLRISLLTATGVPLETAHLDVELTAQCIDPPVYVDDASIDFMVGTYCAAMTTAFLSLCFHFSMLS